MSKRLIGLILRKSLYQRAQQASGFSHVRGFFNWNQGNKKPEEDSVGKWKKFFNQGEATGKGSFDINTSPPLHFIKNKLFSQIKARLFERLWLIESSKNPRNFPELEEFLGGAEHAYTHFQRELISDPHFSNLKEMVGEEIWPAIEETSLEYSRIKRNFGGKLEIQFEELESALSGYSFDESWVYARVKYFGRCTMSSPPYVISSSWRIDELIFKRTIKELVTGSSLR